MVDMEALKHEIEASGMSMVFIAKKSGILRATLYNRLDGVGEFTASEIDGLAKTLRFSTKKRDEIFFNSKRE
jgi:predicted transcriptional regulator